MSYRHREEASAVPGAFAGLATPIRTLALGHLPKLSDENSAGHFRSSGPKSVAFGDLEELAQRIVEESDLDVCAIYDKAFRHI